MSATARKLGNTLWDTLKLVRPKAVIAVDTDGKEHRVNIPEHVGRNRHQHVMQALDGIDWEHVDLLDGKGGLLKRHHRTVDDREPAGELEDVVKSRELSQMHGLLALMLKAQDVALSRQSQGLAQVLDAQNKILEVAMRRLEASEDRLTKEIDSNYQLSHELLVKQLEGALPPEGEEGETQAGAALAQVLPAVLQQWLRSGAREMSEGKKPTSGGGASSSSSSNGHAKKAPSSERRSPPPAGEPGREGS